MNALKRELTKAGIIWNEPDIPNSPNDSCQQLVTITETAIICAWFSDVMDTELRLFDRKTLEPIGGQYLYPETMLMRQGKTWGSYVYSNGKE